MAPTKSRPLMSSIDTVKNNHYPRLYYNKSGRPKKIASAEEMYNRFVDYFDLCDSEDRPYTVVGMALACGMCSAQELYEYYQYEGFYETLKTAKTIVEQQRVEALLTCKTSPVGMIFDLKNNFGWKDVTELKHSGNVQLSSGELDKKLAVLLQAAYKLGAISQPALDSPHDTEIIDV